MPLTPTPTSSPVLCWKQIGIEGDRSCVELAEFVHCRNCSVYTRASHELLNQVLPAGYQDEWAEIFAKPHQSTQTTTWRSLAIFRLGDEWFSLNAELFDQVTNIVPIRRIPQRSNDVLLGLVNISGELQLCISLAQLLGLSAPQLTPTQSAPTQLAPTQSAPTQSTPAQSIPAQSALRSIPESTGNRAIATLDGHPRPLNYPRLVVINLNRQRWVFPVDEIYGIERFDRDAIKPPPSNVSKAQQHLTQNIVAWRDHWISHLDDELLHQTLLKMA
jgi:chemotaxis-related protein WspD